MEIFRKRRHFVEAYGVEGLTLWLGAIHKSYMNCLEFWIHPLGFGLKMCHFFCIQMQLHQVMTICTIDVHSRDTVSKMIQQKVETIAAFSWQSQLRHRWQN